jgi:hypothetical protein
MDKDQNYYEHKIGKLIIGELGQCKLAERIIARITPVLKTIDDDINRYEEEEEFERHAHYSDD